MLVVRFSRVGRKNRPQFRIVVQEHTAAPTGKHTEIVGSWDPNQKKGTFNNERIEYWMSQGAQVSDSVYNLLVSQEIIKGDKRKIKISKKKTKGEEGEAPKKEDGEKAADKAEDAPAEETKEEKKEEVKEEIPKEEAKEEKPSEEKKEKSKEDKK